jgi:glycosyltransferase involved in cell wall biosynthesis
MTTSRSRKQVLLEAQEVANGSGPSTAGLRLLVTVTLNPNQIRAHLEPILALPEVAGVTLVADKLAPEMPKLTTIVPPRFLMRVLGRAGAKLVVCLLYARRHRPDWVVAYNLMPHGINVFLVGKLTGTKSLFHLIGGTEEWQGGGWDSDNRYLKRLPRPVALLERLFLALISRFDAVVTMGTRSKRMLVERGADPNRIHVIPASVDEARFQPVEDAEALYDIVTVAQLIPRKRIQDLVAAVGKLRRSRPDLKVAIVGVGPLEDELRATVDSAGLGDVVEFLGFRRDIEAIYRQSRVFVLTSAHEGLSIALSEAMASGLPAVVSDVSEAPDLVHNDQNGFRYPLGNVERLVECLSAVLDDEQRRTRFGRAAAEDAREVAGLQRAKERYRELLDRDS